MQACWSLLCLFEKTKVVDSFLRLCNPDYFEGWGYQLPEGITLTTIKTQLEAFANDTHRTSLASHGSPFFHHPLAEQENALITFGTPLQTEEIAQHRYFTFNILPIFSLELSQRFHSRYAQMLAFQIILPTSSLEQPQTSRGAWFILKPALEALEPFYCFSTTLTQHHRLPASAMAQELIFQKPWDYFWDTMIYSKRLVNLMDATRFKDIDYNTSYFYDKLENGLLWLSSPRGLGNEHPENYLVKSKACDYMYDPRVKEFIIEADAKHRKTLRTLLALKQGIHQSKRVD